MPGALILIVIIAIAIDIYMRHTTKRNRASGIDSVKQYHDNYKRKRTHVNHLRGTDDTYRTYVTKYNSNEDYRERHGR